jgi:3alpha(or 20beta)-hydroxysteroid dehydrogenase
MTVLNRLDGKVAVITGGAQGLGSFFAETFVNEGARVVITDIAAEPGRALAEKLGDRAIFVEHDVASEDGWVEVVGQAEAAFDHIDVLVNNAAVGGRAPIADFNVDDFMRTVAVNQLGPSLGMRAVIPSMSRAGGGSIVNIGTGDAILAPLGVFAYVGAKTALRGITWAAAGELAPLGIRVNIVHFTGTLRHGMLQRLLDGPSQYDMTAYAKALPMGRFSEPEEIAAMVLFLASDESSYCNGGDFVVDGGKTAVYNVPTV